MKSSVLILSILFISVMISGCIFTEYDNDDKTNEPVDDFSWGSEGSLSINITLSKNTLNLSKDSEGKVLNDDFIRVKYRLTNTGDSKFRVLWNFSDYHDTIFEIKNNGGERLKRLSNPWTNGPVTNTNLLTLEPEENHTLEISIKNYYYDFKINNTYSITGIYNITALEFGGSDGTERLFPYWSGNISSETFEIRIIGS